MTASNRFGVVRSLAGVAAATLACTASAPAAAISVDIQSTTNAGNGLIPGNSYDINYFTMYGWGGAFVNPAATGLASVPVNSNHVFTGVTADGSGEISIVFTDNNQCRAETISGIEIRGDFVSSVPEPSVVLLAAIGLLGLTIAGPKMARGSRHTGA